MDRQRRAKAKRLLIAVSLSWLALGGWLAFFALPADEVQTINSPEVKDRLRDECAGSFRDRYQCKEAIVLQVGQDAFANMALRLILVVSVPLMAAVAYHTLCRPDPITRLPIPDDLAWKPVHPGPHPPAHHAQPGEPSPAPPPDDDWKRRAQDRIAHARPPGPLDKVPGEG